MPRYVAFLRGVSPLNAKMAELKRAFESAGFSEVKTVLTSGNVVFIAPPESEALLARQAEAAMNNLLSRTFYTVVRPIQYLMNMIAADPYAAFDLPVNAKRLVAFLGEPRTSVPSLPIENGNTWILTLYRNDLLSAYIPNARGSSIMPMIEKIFGNRLTTRTWETVKKCADSPGSTKTGKS